MVKFKEHFQLSVFSERCYFKVTCQERTTQNYMQYSNPYEITAIDIKSIEVKDILLNKLGHKLVKSHWIIMVLRQDNDLCDVVGMLVLVLLNSFQK